MIRLLVGIVLVCLVALGAGALTVFHRSERCVQDVLQAQKVHLSTWEAIAKCQR